jgi:AraC-like DNA-binding protein
VIRRAHRSADRPALEAAGRALVERLAPAAAQDALDPRVARMVAWAGRHAASPIGIAEAARAVNLSPSRASHLFATQTGLAFRTYVLWLRLMRAVETYAAGGSLTEAAHEAGFSDSAHLSRTFRRMFGLPANALRLV